MALPIVYWSEPPGPLEGEFLCHVLRLDDRRWLDPADPTGATWGEIRKDAGFPLSPLQGSLVRYHTATLPSDSWPDGLDVLVFVHQRGSSLPVAHELVRVWQPLPLTGRISIPIEIGRR